MSDILASFFGKPLPVADYWLWLALPICLSISMVYKTTRAGRFRQIIPSAVVLFASMIGGVILVTLGLWLITFL